MSVRNPNLEIYTLPRLQVFVTLVDEQTVRRAARVLQISEQAVKKNIASLRRGFGDRELVAADPASGRLRPTELGRAVYDRARRMLDVGLGMDDLNRTLRPERTVAFLPHHAEFVAPMVAALDQNPDFELQVTVLGEQHRSTDVFQQVAIGSLIAGTYDVVLGPPPRETDDDLDTRDLYEAGLVALVPADHADSVSVAELAAQTRLLVPPADTRAGRMIRNALRPLVGSEDELENKIWLSAYGTKVLTIFGARDLGTVVVPSDIAHTFGPGGTLHGSRLDHRKWVPVLTDQPTPLTYRVVATVRHASMVNDPAIGRILDTLKRTVAVELASGPVTALP